MQKVGELVVTDSCKLRDLEELPVLSKVGKKLTKILLTQHKEQVESEENQRFQSSLPHCLLASAGKISHSLIQWIWTMSDPLLLWDQFHPQQTYQPLDLRSPKIDISLEYPFPTKEKVVIETLNGGEFLYEGSLESGRVQGNIDPHLVDHPGWRGRLVLGIIGSSPIIDYKSNEKGTVRISLLHTV